MFKKGVKFFFPTLCFENVFAKLPAPGGLRCAPERERGGLLVVGDRTPARLGPAAGPPGKSGGRGGREIPRELGPPQAWDVDPN